MSQVSRPPLSKHLPPGAWPAAAWAVTTSYSFLTWDAAHRYTIALSPMPGLPNGFRREAQLTRPHEITLTAVAAVLTLAGSAFLRRVPLRALSLLLAGSIAATVNSSPILLLQFLPVDVALYLIATHRTRRTAAAALALTVGTMAGYSTVRLLAGPGSLFGLVTMPAAPPGDRLSTDLITTLAAVVAWTVGTSSRQAREYAVGLAAQAATAERLRLSRELHDSVAHSIGIIAILAGAARRVIHTQPAEAREALGNIETTSRDTLTDLQRMLRALRDEELDAGRQALTLPSASGLRDLERLAAQASGAGVKVDVTWRGERRTLPPEIDRSAFRIIQEAVTNVVRHSGTDACRVDVGFEPDGVRIEIVDDGIAGGVGGGGGSAYVASGFGLLGMRERVTLLSGQFSAGPRPEGGFRVAVRLPA